MPTIQHPHSTSMTVDLELSDMPEVPTRRGAKGIIAHRAIVTFDIESGTPVFYKIELRGFIPLKTGGPSQRSTSDWHYGPNSKLSESMPQPIQDLVDYATTYVTGLLK